MSWVYQEGSWSIVLDAALNEIDKYPKWADLLVCTSVLTKVELISERRMSVGHRLYLMR